MSSKLMRIAFAGLCVAAGLALCGCASVPDMDWGDILDKLPGKDKPDVPPPPAPAPPQEPVPAPEPPPVSTRPLTGQESGFIWKPVSDRGTLVVLLPRAFTHRTGRVLEMIHNDRVIERSRRAHDDAVQPNGNREHYRFAHPGAAYPAPVFVRIEAEGQRYIWPIANPATRYDDRNPVKAFIGAQ